MISVLDREFFKKAMHESGAEIRSESSDDIIVRCPICGDSAYNKNKARLHLYGKFGVPLVNCFNGDCPVQNIPIGKFLKLYYPSIFNEYQRRTLQESVQSDNAFRDDWDKWASPNKSSSDLCLFDLSKIFIPLEQSQKALRYLESRGFVYQSKWKWFFSKSNVEINGKVYTTADSIIIPLYKENKWYGFYSRNIFKKSFATYMPEKNSGYKVWNLFSIDKSKPVYIFEGIFDALSLYVSGETNVLACLGATLPNHILDSLAEPILCYDNDKTGIANMVKTLKDRNFRCKALVCTTSGVKDMNEMLQAGINVKNFVDGHVQPGVSAVVALTQLL